MLGDQALQPDSEEEKSDTGDTGDTGNTSDMGDTGDQSIHQYIDQSIHLLLLNFLTD